MNAISLFSGAGGFDVGFKKAGFDILWANDINGDACETYRNNIGNHIQHGDINSLKQAPIMDLSGIDVVFGGPPAKDSRSQVK
jgi:DNA (cytosine-5)-methyltransferase 1